MPTLREIKKAKGYTNVDNGGTHLLTPQEAKEHPERVEQLGMWPIGSKCSKDHPELKEYLIVEAEK